MMIQQETDEQDKRRRQMMVDSSVIIFNVLLLIGVLALVYYRDMCIASPDDDPLLPNEEVGHLAGLTRDKLEDESLEASKWTCGVCAFHNPPERTCCELCDTCQAVFLLMTPEFEHVDGTIPLHQLNDRQLSARNRAQWRRQLNDDTKQWEWVAEIAPTDGVAYYIIGTLLPDQPFAYLPLTSATAEMTTLGKQLPTWWSNKLRELQDLPFSLKYAWLLAHLAETYRGHTKLKIARDNVFEHSLGAFAKAPVEYLCALTHINFVGEGAVDAGGVTREWYSVLSLAILEPTQGLFITNKTDQSFFINPNSAKDHGPNHLERYLAIGRLLGRAIVDEQVLPFQFSVPLFKALLGYPVSIEDIRYLDPVVYSSLVFVRDCTSDVAELALTFSATLDASTEVDLVPNGRAIEVTCANKAEY
ncbi:hypothetical protein As57867_006064, partial [Aphanomyces stellatus]